MTILIYSLAVIGYLAIGLIFYLFAIEELKDAIMFHIVYPLIVKFDPNYTLSLNGTLCEWRDKKHTHCSSCNHRGADIIEDCLFWISIIFWPVFLILTMIYKTFISNDY